MAESDCPRCGVPLIGLRASGTASPLHPRRAAVYSVLAGVTWALCGMVGPVLMLYAAATEGKGAGAVAALLVLIALTVAPFVLAWKGYRARGSRYPFLFVVLVAASSFVAVIPILMAVLAALSALTD